MSEQATMLAQMQEMMAHLSATQDRMAAMQAELDSLKAQVQSPVARPGAAIYTSNPSRRRMLRRLAGGMLAGLAVGSVAAVGPESAQARMIVDPLVSDSSRRIGAIVVPPGSPMPGGAPVNPVKYGLVASDGSDTSFDLSKLSLNSAGVSGFGVSGIYGNGNTGVFGNGTDTGVYGNGTTQGVFGNGTKYGVYGNGPTAVFGYGTTTGVKGFGNTTGGIFVGTKVGCTSTAYGTSGGGLTGGTTVDTTFVGLVGNSGVNIDLGSLNAGYNIGVYGIAANNSFNYAGFFQGDVNITGKLTKGNGTFKIDHPLDPTNKYLYHSFVESPDMMNIYNGIARLDGQGCAEVELPGYFEALNTAYRYGLTSIGRPSPNLHIAQEIKDRRFVIGGGLPGQRVSWMVTGIRQDAYAKAHPIQVEEDKPQGERGHYLHPQEYGQPVEQGR